MMLADRRHTVDSSSSSCASRIQRIHCHFTGRVQGVGFRYTVKNIALSHDVSGFVRNLPDGRVELLMEGPAQEIDQVIEGITGRMNQYIKNIERLTMPATGEFDHFQIKH